MNFDRVRVYFLAVTIACGLGWALPGWASSVPTNVISYQKISDGTGGGPNLDPIDNFGSGLDGIGDLDGDGVEDMAVGAPYEDITQANSGAAYVLFMNTNGTVKASHRIGNTSGDGISLHADEYFGISVCRLGDLDGDGVTDLAVGSRHTQSSLNSCGGVYVLFMNTNGTVKAKQLISHNLGGGPPLEALDYFGDGVDGLGDFYGDGVEDLAVGAWGDDDGDGGGAVYMLFLNTNGTVKSYQKISEITEGGPALDAGDRFGAEVAAGRDFDGDGTSDLVVGVPLDDDGNSAAGAVYVLFLNATTGTVREWFKISATSGNGPDLDPSDSFGTGVAILGNYNRGRLPEIGIGASLDDDGGDAQGAVYVLFLDVPGKPGTVFSFQ